MRRALPTTLAAVAYRLGDHTVRCRSLWAGDSRAYVLLPTSGLHALTRDHTAEEDALDQLRQDPPMTNVVCADRPFTIEAQPPHSYGEFPLPCVLLSATDGFFGYVHTPAHFEHLLLNTLAHARDMADWADRLRTQVQGFTADDASLSLAALGFDSFPQIAEAFRVRHDAVTETYAKTFPERYGHDPRVPRGRDPLRYWQEQTWATYRPGYERYMPPPSQDTREADARHPDTPRPDTSRPDARRPGTPRPETPLPGERA
jgi:hypothetical protein